MQSVKEDTMTLSKLVFDPFYDDTSLPLRRSTTSQAGYRVGVIGCSVADVIRSAGGWLCDRAMAGWDVNVGLADDADIRPLRILGVQTVAADRMFASVTNGCWKSALAVSAQALTARAGARRVVVAAMERGIEVTVWGEAESDRHADNVVHRLSVAARAFKACALAAESLDQIAVTPTENYRPLTACSRVHR